MILNRLFETSTLQKKFEAQNILLEVKDGEPVFLALICIPLRNKDGNYEYGQKDSDKIEELLAESNECWQIELREKGCWLKYYPYECYRQTFPKTWHEHCGFLNLGTIARDMTIHIGGKV